MISNVRVRFAPSPTGPLHIGGLRTAIYNYLFARKNEGTFILRIEDTDQARFVAGAEEYIVESLKWCGIEIDEGVNAGGSYGPYRQSERKGMYRQYIDELIGLGKAYYAFDTPEELDMQRKVFEGKGESFMYNSHIRNSLRNSLTLPAEEVSKMIDSGVNYVVRFKTPENEEVAMKDLIRGEVVVNTGTLDDKVLLKADGMPTYHLANIIDDHLMEISHVIRGEEWLPSLPSHVLLYRAFGWEEPEFAHMSLLLKPTGEGKLSKRDGDKLGFSVFPLYWPYEDTARGYREDGYFPDAFVNMLALLGWSPGTDKEIFSMDEMIAEFSIEKIGKSGIHFNPEKAKWYNHQYMQMKAVEEITEEFIVLLNEKGYRPDNEKVNDLVKMVRERTSFISELWDQTDYFFEAPQDYDEKFVKKRWKESSPVIMGGLRAVLAEIDDFSSANTEGIIKAWIEKNEYGMGAVMNAFRLLIVGAGRGPHLFDIIAWIGKDETLARIDKGLIVLGE